MSTSLMLDSKLFFIDETSHVILLSLDLWAHVQNVPIPARVFLPLVSVLMGTDLASWFIVHIVPLLNASKLLLSKLLKIKLFPILKVHPGKNVSSWKVEGEIWIHHCHNLDEAFWF